MEESTSSPEILRDASLQDTLEENCLELLKSAENLEGQKSKKRKDTPWPCHTESRIPPTIGSVINSEEHQGEFKDVQFLTPKQLDFSILEVSSSSMNENEVSLNLTDPQLCIGEVPPNTPNLSNLEEELTKKAKQQEDNLKEHFENLKPKQLDFLQQSTPHLDSTENDAPQITHILPNLPEDLAHKISSNTNLDFSNTSTSGYPTSSMSEIENMTNSSGIVKLEEQLIQEAKNPENYLKENLDSSRQSSSCSTLPEILAQKISSNPDQDFLLSLLPSSSGYPKSSLRNKIVIMPNSPGLYKLEEDQLIREAQKESEDYATLEENEKLDLTENRSPFSTLAENEAQTNPLILTNLEDLAPGTSANLDQYISHPCLSGYLTSEIVPKSSQLERLEEELARKAQNEKENFKKVVVNLDFPSTSSLNLAQQQTPILANLENLAEKVSPNLDLDFSLPSSSDEDNHKKDVHTLEKKKIEKIKASNAEGSVKIQAYHPYHSSSKEKDRKKRNNRGVEALKRLVPGLEPDAKENKVCEMTIKYIEFMKTHVGSEADKEFLMNQIF